MKSRTMLSLPAMVHEDDRWTLPLCDATALALAGALVDESLSSRASTISAALAVDPAFAVWSVYRFVQNSPTVGPTSTKALAEWLASRLFDLLDWSDPAPLTFSAELHGQFAAMVAESVTVASETARVLGETDPNTRREYLAALTSHWRQWLATCGNSGVETVLLSWPLATPTVSEPFSVEARAAGDEAWRRWLTEIPGVHSLLPPLVTQMRQAAALQTDFDKRLHTAKLESLKEFAYGAGHELNNPLANIATRAQTLLQEESHPERRRRLAAINTQAFRAHEMLADVMLFAKPPRIAPEQIDLVRLANDVLAELADDAVEQQTSLHRPSREEPLLIEADPVQLRVALRAMCVNSLEALGRGGNVTIEVQPAGSSQAEITITDDGPGIAPEIRQKIFDPFFSGREAGRGLGFGLSKCWRIVTLHGGQIIVHSQPGRGATFTITLPTHFSQAAPTILPDRASQTNAVDR